MGSSSSSALDLYDYQKRWVTDKARFKIGMWSRQSGKSFSTSLEAVLDGYENRTKWVFLSAGERQSKELMLTAQMHARAVSAAVDIIESRFREDDRNEYKQLEIKIPRTGSRIIGLPANPSTARGHSANILLDEFAFHQDSRAIWRALFPTVTRGFKIRIVSTPQGKQNKFYELWSGNERYSKHFVPIYEAVRQGLTLADEDGNPCSPEDLRAALGDEDAWSQEYLCEFLDEATAWITYDQISEAEVQTLERVNPPAGGGTLWAGVDVGRKRDLTVFWMIEQVGDVFWSRHLEEFDRVKFSRQRERIFELVREHQPRRICMDATGIGMQLAEEAVEAFGEFRVEPVTFTIRSKEDLATSIKRAFEDKRIRIPVDRKIREDIHSIRKTTTSAGNVRFDAERSDDGHADRFWALALALHAAGKSAAPAIYAGTDPAPRRRSELMGDDDEAPVDALVARQSHEPGLMRRVLRALR